MTISTASGRQPVRYDRAGLSRLMASYSENSIGMFCRLLTNQSGRGQRSGAFKRACAMTLAPFKCCYDEIALPDMDDYGHPITFSCANMKQLLSRFCELCPSAREAFGQSLQTPVRVTIAHDECTSGNVLNAAQRQKVLLFYAFLEPFFPIVESSRGWIPVAAIAHDQLAAVQGGISAVTAAFARHWEQQRLATPFRIFGAVTISLQWTTFISDMDSQRAAWAAKGSAALKPCIFCSNCVMKDATGAQVDEQFRTVAEHRFDLFVQTDHDDLQHYIANCLRQVPHMSKKNRELIERCCGFRLDSASVWNCPRTMRLFRLDMTMNDAMHCYFSNGIVNSEIVQLLSEVQRQTGMTTKALCDATVAAGWSRHSSNETKYWVKRLWVDAYFGNEQYKGQAGRTLAIMALLRWYAETLWLRVPELQEAANCFLLLCKCQDALSRCKHTRHWSQLATCQQEHQEAFARLRPDQVRPKHHHRLHLPAHFQRNGLAVTCWGVESSHMSYKSTFAGNLQQWLTAERGGADFSAKLMSRLLLRHCELFNDLPFLPKGWQLVRPFSEADVRRETGVEGCSISARCRLHTVELAERDILLWGLQWHEAGEVNFFLETDGRLLLCVTQLQLQTLGQSYRTFHKTGVKQMVAFEALQCLKVPSWTSVEDDKVICLP